MDTLSEKEERNLLISIFNFFKTYKNENSKIDQENLEVGLQCLMEAFQISNDENGNQNPTLTQIYKQFILSKSKQPIDELIQDPIVIKHPELWKKWVGKLEAKGFFKGTEKSSEEYVSRYNKAIEKFKEKFATSEPEESLEDKQNKAEEVKSKGNSAMSAKKYDDAVKFYQEAVNLCPNGPNSHIYYANLGAALMHIEQYNECIENCEKAIELQPAYAKSYSRMGAAHFHLMDYNAAIDAYRRGLEIDSNNEACLNGIEDAENAMKAFSTASSSKPAESQGNIPNGIPGGIPGGMPDLSNLSSMMGEGGLAGLMNNPAIANMMQNPAMMQMAQNMMQNPEMMSNMMNSLGGNAGGIPSASTAAKSPANSGNRSAKAPDLSSLMSPEGLRNFMQKPPVQALRSDPDMHDFFADVDSKGISGAMKHLSNPKVSSKIQKLFAALK